ncbi:MAG: DUF4167 domain-containing protein [Devosia nanyangense]|uniref:DUF4167 domain-containing protein n=1 Tax=Devosia nanyangense TaxID=1228055 RepID=A0A933NZS5_9HYPH|nr:DUF4167 domain-containing protein [Devosia nanyangense]
MRPNQNINKNRQRGRNNNNGGRKHINPLSRNFESNGPDVKVRGNASHVAEKYLQLARDAQSSGDPVLAENYLQHAEHYFRIVAAAQPQNQGRPDQFGNTQEQDDDDDFPPMNDRFASPEPIQPFRPQQPDQQGFSGDEGGESQSQPQVAAPVSQQQGEQASAEDGQSAAGPQGEGDVRRHRDRNRRRRGRAPGEGGQGGGDPANAPQPEVGELPAFLTAGTTPTAAE